MQEQSHILAISDLHLTDNPTESYRHDFMRDLPRIIAKRKPQALAILGDLTEEKDRHPSRLVNQIVSELHEIAEIVPLLVMMGNHDYRNEGHPFFAFLSRLRNIVWVDKVTEAAALPKDFRSIFAGCIFLPHTHNYVKDWGALPLGFGDYRFVFAHNTFDGSKTPTGHLLDGIPISVFPKKAKVIAGDVHTPQTIGPVTYIGAPYTVDFGDAYDPRMLELRGHGMSSVSLKQWPQKRLVVVDDLADLEKAKVREGDIVKVRITQDDIGNWGSIHRDIVAWANRAGVHLFRAEPVMSRQIVRRQHRVRPHDQADDRTLLKQYAKRHDLDTKTLDAGMEFVK